MCLITTQHEPLTATEDMLVYKMFGYHPMKQELYAPHIISFKYETGRLYETEIKEYDGKHWTCADNEDTQWLNANFPDWWPNGCPGLKCFANGFHFATTKERLTRTAFFRDDLLFKECIVPKGSIYYLDATGLGVANKIILK